MDLHLIQYFEKTVVKINRILIKVLSSILFLLFAVLILIVTINVVFRYVLKNPLFWVTELSCYILVYLIFFGAALALYRGEHVGMNIEGIKVPFALKKLFERIGILFNYSFIVLLVVFGILVSVKNLGSYTGSLPIPMGYVYMAAPISGIAMLSLYTEHIFAKKKDR
jgi:TRAP-type C4-dicarboxylate transport system permease small subunit